MDLLGDNDALGKKWWVDNPRYGYANNEQNHVPGWRGYVNYAVDHALAGGTFDRRMLDRNKHGVQNYEGYANINPLLQPGKIKALPVSAMMLVEICRELRKRGKRFPTDKIEDTFRASLETQTLPGEEDYVSGEGYQPVTREQLIEKSRYSVDYGELNIEPWDFRPLDEAVAMVEGHLDQVEAYAAKKEAESSVGSWFSARKFRPATRSDYLEFLADHLEAGGRITSVSDRPVTEWRMDDYRVDKEYRIGPDRKRAFKRLGLRQSEMGAVWMVATEDFDLPPAGGAIRLNGVICKPGVKRISMGDDKERMFVPGEIEHVKLPIDLAEPLGKLLKRRGVTLAEGQLPEMDANERQRVWGKHAPEIQPAKPSAASAPTL